MANVENISEPTVSEFLDIIYDDMEGYAYIATKTPADKNKSVQNIRWEQEFFFWPRERHEVVAFIQEKTPSHEVYFSPSLFKEPSALKESVQGSKVFWCEFDGKIPTELGNIPEPSLKVISSKEGHEHWYWRTEEVYTPEQVERINRGLTYALGADASGWDAGQVLRPIGTINHKRSKRVTLKKVSLTTTTLSEFSELPEPPPEAPIPEIDNIPVIEDVIPKYKFKDEVWDLFKHGSKRGDRSDGLMSLGYYLAEMGVANDEMFSMLINADERWGKFSGRTDQNKRLMEIVVRARVKYPILSVDSIELKSLGYKTVLSTTESVEWIWEGLLHTTGYMLVTGPSGVGKTQFSLNAAARMVLGQDFLGRKSGKKGVKIGVFSLEMGVSELKTFLETQAGGYTEEELEILEKNLRFFPLGEPIYLTKESEKEKIEKIVKEENLQGLIFDSLGSVTESSLSNEENVKNLMDWNDRLRKRLGIFTWYIHHHRKASGENKKPNKLGDVYGSQYLTARTSSVLCLWDIGIKDTVQCIPLKVRFIEKPLPFNMHRDKNLQFHSKVSGITVVPEGTSDDEIEEEKATGANTIPGKDKGSF